MYTAPYEPHRRAPLRRMATEPIEPLHPYSIPIPPYKHRDSREKPHSGPHKKTPREERETPKPERPPGEGLIDDYA